MYTYNSTYSALTGSMCNRKYFPSASPCIRWKIAYIIRTEWKGMHSIWILSYVISLLDGGRGYITSHQSNQLVAAAVTEKTIATLHSLLYHLVCSRRVAVNTNYYSVSTS